MPIAHLAAYPVANDQLQARIGDIQSQDYEPNSDTRSELDSHANMIVLGKHCYIISYSGRQADVKAFSPEAGQVQSVPIVDAAIAYDCPFSMKTYILIARNALHIPSMENNLIPPFIMREAAVTVNDTAKIHTKDPTVEDHSIYFEEIDLRIPLSLAGVFSCFPTRKPTPQDLLDGEKIVISPEGPQWNPHSESYKVNEDLQLDWKGEMIERQYQQRVLIEETDILDEESVIAMCCDVEFLGPSEFSDDESKMIDHLLNDALQFNEELDRHECFKIPRDQDEIMANLSSINSTLDPTMFARMLSDRAARSKFAMSIGSASTRHGLTEIDDLFEDPLIEVQALHAESPQGLKPQDLAKVWKIDIEAARRTLEITTQLKKQDANGNLSRNFSTNDQTEPSRDSTG